MLNIVEKGTQIIKIPRTSAADPSETLVLRSVLRNDKYVLECTFEHIYSDYILLNADFSNVVDGEYIYATGEESGICIVGDYIERSKHTLDEQTITPEDNDEISYYYE